MIKYLVSTAPSLGLSLFRLSLSSKSGGCVQNSTFATSVFACSVASKYSTFSTPVRLQKNDPKKSYLVSNRDKDVQEHRRGRELLDDGLPVTMVAKLGVAILTYRKQQ